MSINTMETLLPSEIARLVLGYLEDQKCVEAAKTFLDTSPHLQECRFVMSSGRRFSTRVSGMTLIDVIEKLFAINATVQDRLHKITDCQQLKQCGDLLEQLKFLIEETRGQRFVVNINVPSQSSSQVCNGSPVISSSTRKRRHSNSDRERCKRTKVTMNASQQSDSHSVEVTSFDNIEATPLESLPGNIDTFKQCDTHANGKEKKCNNSSQQYQAGGHQNTRNVVDDIVPENTCKENNGLKNSSCMLDKCTATNTEKLLNYSCVEVQTTPYDTPESESETNDEPIENLSLLTKELLNRTELQERIAENINKAILPTDTSLKDENLNDSANGEANTSIVTELNNAIKSIVEATEADPVFEKFLDEIIGPNTETDTSPDEDIDAKPKSKFLNESEEKQGEMISSNDDSPESVALDVKSSSELDTADVPLKHRLRSSSRQQSARIEDERDQEKEHSNLDDQNAAAVLSIINANIVNNKPGTSDKRIVDTTKETPCSLNNDSEKKLPSFEISLSKDAEQVGKLLKEEDEKAGSNLIGTAENNDLDAKVKKSATKRLRPVKPKQRGMESVIDDYTPEQDIITLPTLIVCSKDEISNILSINPCYPPTCSVISASTSRFVPIVPKNLTTATTIATTATTSITDSNKTEKSFAETLYLKTVNVVQKVTSSLPNTLGDSRNLISSSTTTTTTATTITTAATESIMTMAVTQTFKKGDNSSKPKGISIHNVHSFAGSSVVNPASLNTEKLNIGESITLYANENSAKTLLDSTSMPTISIEDNVSLSSSGLSPYIKFNCSKGNRNQNLSDIDLTPIVQSATDLASFKTNNVVNDQHLSAAKNTECDIISKRTPRSLLRSRSKNHRLSLSTPRRRSNHIRALDFNTPMKTATLSDKSIGENEDPGFSTRPTKHVKSLCKSSLFKSPPFTNNSTMTTDKVKTELKACRPCTLPMVNKSPVSKIISDPILHNNEDVVIIDDVPSQSSVSVSSESKALLKSSNVKNTWDADLRKALQITSEEDTAKTNKKDCAKTGKSAMKKDKCNTRATKGKTKNFNPLKEDNIVEKAKDECPPVIENETDASIVRDKDRNEVSSPGKVLSNAQANETRLAETVADVKPVKPVEPGDARRRASTEDKCKALQVEQTFVKESHQQYDESVTTIDNSSAGKKNVKKYVPLKRLKSNLNKCKEGDKKDPSFESTNGVSVDGMQCSEFAKASTDVGQQLLLLPKLTELETPRKFENISGVPPTPRLLSPSSNTTPFVKSTEDNSSKMRGFINTPECPITPCIALTPKNSEEITTDDAKKEAFSSDSPYYKPSSEQDKNFEKSLKLTSTNNTQKSSSAPSQYIKQPPSPNNTTTSANMYQACVTAKLEITQFEVIKENLPKEEAIKELKISANSRDSAHYMKLKAECIQDTVNKEITMKNEKNHRLNSEDSNDSDASISSNNSSVSSSSSSSSSSSTSSSSSSSSSSTSSSSSSSSSSSTSSPISSSGKVANSMAVSSSNNKDKEVSNQIYTDTSNDSMRKDTQTVEIMKKSDSSKQIIDAKEEIIALKNVESSPLKVFPILKNEEDLNAKETPAKDENLLNEIDISETPSSSKAGVDNLTNLSSKISALITSADRKSLLKTGENIGLENSSIKKLKQKPKIVSIQRVRANSSIPVKPTTSTKHSSVLQKRQKPATVDEKFVVQLEAKRQRVIAKFRDIPKRNPTRGKTQQERRTTSKSENTVSLRKKNIRCKQSQESLNDSNEKKRKRKKKKKETDDGNGNNSNDNIKCNKNNSGNDNDAENGNTNNDKGAKGKHLPATSVSEGKKCINLENSEEKGNDEKCVEGNLLTSEAVNRIPTEMAEQEPRKIIQMLSDKGETTDANVDRIKEKQSDRPITRIQTCNPDGMKIDETVESKTGEKSDTRHDRIGVSIKETSVQHTEKPNQDSKKCGENGVSSQDNTKNEEEVCKLKEYHNYNGKTSVLMKSKVDQVKRDLFSDEENEHKTHGTNKISNNEKNVDVDHPSKTLKETNDSENPKNLSRVLQCLQLVPTCKQNPMAESQYQYMKSNRKTDLNETIPNSVEYHFLYDDSMPFKKRRRRYSNRELEFQINVVLNDPNHDEYIKVMTATDYEEIFNLPPKPRKRLGNKKSPVKHANSCEAFKSIDPSNIKNIHAKPLATSSPVEKPVLCKVKKVSGKATTLNERSNEPQHDGRKRVKVDKTREIDKDNNIGGKMAKRRTSEVKESNKQIDKRQYVKDPQVLLSKLDLDQFLTSVHGPA